MKISEKLLRSERYSKNRMENLSDGVFGFAMTLLVLNIAIPESRLISTNRELLSALTGQGRAFLSFTIAFFILASMWGLHVRQFENLEKVDRKFVFLNNIRLFLVIMVAFSTSIASSYDRIELARMILPINYLLLAVIGTVQWSYAISSKPPLLIGISAKEKRIHSIRAFWFILLAVIAVILSYFVGEISFFVFSLMLVVVRLTRQSGGNN